MRKLFSPPSILPKRLGLPGRNAVTASLSQRPEVALSEDNVAKVLTQALIIHVIRTGKIPFLQSRARWPLTVTTVLVIGFGVYLPSSPVAAPLGFVPLPPLDWGFLFLTLICYMGLTQAVKSWLLKKAWA